MRNKSQLCTLVFQLLCLIGFYLLALKVLQNNQVDFRVLAQELLQRIKSLGAFAPIGYIAAYTLGAVLLMPGSLMTISAGLIFGLSKGTFYAWLGANFGAVAAFLVGRYLARKWVLQKMLKNPKFESLVAAIRQEGTKVVILARLSPIVPFNFSNYAFGLSTISLKQYLTGSLGMLPSTFFYVYLGSLVNDLSKLGAVQNDPKTTMLKWVLNVLGLTATIAISIYAARLTKRIFKQPLPKET